MPEYEDIEAVNAAHSDGFMEGDREFLNALGSISEEALWGTPPSADTAFLVRLRERIDAASPTSSSRFPLRSPRFVAALSTFCVLLVVVILGSGPWFGLHSGGDAESTQLFLSALDANPTYEQMLASETLISPDSLAAYLDIPEFTEAWDLSAAEVEPLTDALLELDQVALEEVLNKIANANFF